LNGCVPALIIFYAFCANQMDLRRIVLLWIILSSYESLCKPGIGVYTA